MKNIITILLFTGISYATIINIPADYSTIQQGIDASSNGDTVLVAPGIYFENINFSGKNIMVSSHFLIGENPTIIEQTFINGSQNGSVVLFNNDESNNALLSGFTLTNGSGTYYPSSDWYFGGGIHLESHCNPQLLNLIITGNSATKGSGVFCRNYCSPTIKNVKIHDNYSSHNGGGITLYNNSNPILIDVSITDNYTESNGGGIYGNLNCYPISENVTIAGNNANNNGGSVWFTNNCEINLLNSIIWGNTPGSHSISMSATYSDIQGSWAGEGNIDMNPLFTSPLSGDYTLQSDSPCIDAGDPSSPLDPDGTIVDMGALYFDQTFGCTDESAINYNPNSTIDDGSCYFLENIEPHFQQNWEGSPLNPMEIYVNIASLDEINLRIGDEIGVFDEIGCIGIIQLTTEITTPIQIFLSEDNPDTPEIDGFIAGENINYRFWDASTQIEVVNVNPTILNGDDVFAPLGFSEVELFVTTIFGCTEFNSINYDPDATVNNGSCITTIFGCTDPDATNYDSDATEPCNSNNSCCEYETLINPPTNLTGTGSDGEITLTWDAVDENGSRTDVTLWISDVTEDNVEISMSNSADVYGFQFNIVADPTLGSSFGSASGGSAEDASFLVSTSPVGTVLGFSMTESFIPVGEGVLTNVQWTHSGSDAYLDLSIIQIAGINGTPLSSETGVPVCFGICDPTVITYNVYRDGSLFTQNLEITQFIDGSLGYSETHCYTVTASGGANESGHSNEACATTYEMGCSLEHFSNLPDITGEFSLIIVQSVTGIEVGECDEIGVYDANAILNYATCENLTGELLVGAGVWVDDQLSISTVGSIDYCDVGGSQFPGYVEGNPIIFRYFSTADGMEYEAQATYMAGNGTFGEMITSLTLEIVTSVNHRITLNSYMRNLLSTYMMADDPAVETLFGDQVLIMGNDGGDFYVPQYFINSIGDIDNLEGYSAFINGSDDITFEITGMQIDVTTPFNVDPFMNNIIPYISDTEMPSSAGFGPYNDDILIASNDSGDFYAPAWDVYTLTTLVPGEGYILFLNGDSPLEMSYPENVLSSQVANEWEALKPGLVSQQFDVVKTGVVHPIIVTSLQGNVAVGDEITVYANGTLVGATRVVDTDRPLPVTAWGAINQVGYEQPGFQVGDAIEIRYWSQSQNTELRVTADIEGQYFGMSPLTTGSLVVHSDSAVPTQFRVHPAYPNPFNPIMTISYELPIDSHVTLTVYDLAGHLITELVDETRTVGTYQSVWDASNQSSGVYLVKMVAGDFQSVQKVVLLK
ncbi:MAG: T9SS type A sorting domain-containing protein [Candidatus Marinimicrobia bacterium]|nr:T9SS type A sorting domain-containing protein [Candidatus Neomarinimicrobiota bacterium]